MSPGLSGRIFWISVLIGLIVSEYRLLHSAPRSTLMIPPLAVVVGVYCARVWGSGFYPPMQSVDSSLLAALSPSYAGNASVVGGILGGTATVWFVCWCAELELNRVSSAFFPAVCLAQSIARFGCFVGGCCFGEPTSLPWGVTFSLRTVAGFSMGPVPLHPTQLYEMALDLALFAYLLRLAARGRENRVLAGFLVGSGAIRFAVEFLRADGLAVVGPFDAAQLGSIALIACGLVFLFNRRSSAPLEGRSDVQRSPLPGPAARDLD